VTPHRRLSDRNEGWETTMFIMLAIGLFVLAALMLAAIVLAEAHQGANLEASMRRFGANAMRADDARTYRSHGRAAA
jgi:hypothetical protein